MGGRLYGFLEKRTVFEDEELEWELVLKTEPIVGAAGNFRRVFYNYQGENMFDNIPMNTGFPDDISPETKAVMYSRIRFGHVDPEDIKFAKSDLENIKSLPEESFDDYRWALDLDFYRYFESRAFWITGDQFREIDFQQKVSQEKIEEIKSKLKDHSYGYGAAELQRFFKLNINGQEYSRLWITNNGEIDLSGEEVRRLVKEEKIEKGSRTLEIEPRTINEVLGDSWRNLWNIIKSIRARETEEVRLIFYWNH